MKLSDEIKHCTFEDIDLESWAVKVSEMEKILAIVGYPRRGTPESYMNEYELAELVQDKFNMDDLS